MINPTPFATECCKKCFGRYNCFLHDRTYSGYMEYIKGMDTRTDCYNIFEEFMSYNNMTNEFTICKMFFYMPSKSEWVGPDYKTSWYLYQKKKLWPNQENEK